MLITVLRMGYTITLEDDLCPNCHLSTKEGHTEINRVEHENKVDITYLCPTGKNITITLGQG